MNNVKSTTLILILIVCGFYVFVQKIFADSVNVSAVIVSVCGNGTIDGDEQCDGSNLNGQTCSTRGFSGGSLSCNASCAFNSSACTSASGGTAISSSGGGGGTIAVITTAVNFTGKAYPLSKVTVLKDGQIAATTIAGPDANFNVSLSDLSGGDYTFSVFGEDKEGRHSTLFTFPVFITKGVTTSIGGIFIAPTISVDKNQVRKGDNISIFGQSIPNSDVVIEVNSENEFFLKAKADKNGVYLYDFDTSPLESGDHFTKSKAALGSQISSFSKTVGFVVGLKNVLAEAEGKSPAKGDLNSDLKVNIVDFSIVAYWYKRPAPLQSADFDNDGKVDLTDFSIMAYHWTG